MKKNHPTNDKPTLINSILKFRSKPLIRPGQGNQLSDNHSIQTRSNYTIAGTLLLLHTVLYLLADLLLQNLPELSSILYSDSIRSFAISGLATQGFLILLPVLIVMVVFHTSASNIIGDRPLPGTILLSFVTGIPAAAVFQGLNNLLIYQLLRMGWQIPVVTTPYSFNTNIIWSAPLSIKAVIIIVSALLPAIAEELMFRGVIQGSLAGRSRVAVIIFWQAVAFMLFHLDPLFILPPFMTGLLLGYLRHKSQSLLAPIVCHISLNISLLVLNPLLPRFTKSLLEISSETTRSLLYASLIASCIAAVALVPLIFIIGHQYKSPTPAKVRNLLFPGDWKLILAMSIMIVTIIIRYYNS
jgi:membrane protease YdiL (CAAX protease family)